MLVYGDRSQTVAPRELLAEICELTRAAGDNDALTAALIRAGELAQGLIDAEFDAAGFDDLTRTGSAAMDLALALARRRFCGVPAGADELRALAALPLPETIRCKTPEGYAFYAVYPESYAAAAAPRLWPAPPLVIGLRSIGTSLAATVAAVTGGRAITLRPTGHPFAREVRISPALEAEFRGHAGPFAIVDEGPGLSGSSFGAAADRLASLGVTEDRIAFFPSHAGDLGPMASPRHRARWARAERRLETFDGLLAGKPMTGWFADLIGPAHAAEDLSAGVWRGDLPMRDWPPVAARLERRKYRLTTARGVFLARFAGLGAVGAAKYVRAQELAAAGFTPEPLALRCGFLLERWVEGQALEPHGARSAAFLAHLARYLGFRARRFPAAGEAGADLAVLRDMTIHNAAELCGRPTADRLALRLERLLPRISVLRPVHIDGRLQPWEWRVRPDDGFCKTDALDHAEAHDLVGCQDIAWDVASAGLEFGLSPDDVASLAAAVAEQARRTVCLAAVHAFQICYAAREAGAWTMAEAAAASAELEPLRARRQVCVNWLEAAAGVGGSSGAAPQCAAGVFSEMSLSVLPTALAP